MRMPVLFIAHGSPLTLAQPHRLLEWQQLGQSLPRPKAILAISAHWETRPLTIGATETQPLIYDFYGFPDELYRLTYQAPGAPELASQVRSLLQQQGMGYAERPERGWDHGVWIPLLAMFPQADIPLLQLSLPSQDPGVLMALGEALSDLRDQGVLIVTSGVVTHNLRVWTDDGVVADWAQQFDDWLAKKIEQRDWPALTRWPEAPGARMSVPTAEHLVPLFVAIGASRPDDAIHFPISGFEFGSFSHRSVQFGR